MDNRMFDIVDNSKLEEWIKLAANGKAAIGWAEQEVDKVAGRHRKCLIFYWADPNLPHFVWLPAGSDAQLIAALARNWLNKADYGPQPDHDGDNGKGFRIYVEDWGHVGGRWEAFLAVAPVWAMYGK